MKKKSTKLWLAQQAYIASTSMLGAMLAYFAIHKQWAAVAGMLLIFLCNSVAVVEYTALVNEAKPIYLNGASE